MALGNANSSAQSRGKNKAIVVKRRKEVVLAADFIVFQGSSLQNAAACPLNNADVNITYYHDGSNALPSVGDKIYTKRQRNDKYILTNDHKFIKAGPNRGRYTSVEYKTGQVHAVLICP